MRFERQIAKQERMESHYRKYITALRKRTGARTASRSSSSPATVEDVSPRQHYSVAKKDRDRIDLYALSAKHMGDPALKVGDGFPYLFHFTDGLSQDFIMKLKDHLLARVLNKQYDAELPTFTTKDRDQLYIAEDRLEQRYSMSVYHTTYDLRRGKDRINMKNWTNIMTLSHDGIHPYAYARVLGIYGLDVLHGPTMSDEARMNVLWVHWYEIDETHRAGWKAKRLYRVKPISTLEDGAFGFLDPEDIIRGSHLIPGFVLGHRTTSPSDPASLWDPEEESDWKTYYVNR